MTEIDAELQDAEGRYREARRESRAAYHVSKTGRVSALAVKSVGKSFVTPSPFCLSAGERIPLEDVFDDFESASREAGRRLAERRARIEHLVDCLERDEAVVARGVPPDVKWNPSPVETSRVRL